MSLFSFKKEPNLSFVFDIRDSSVTLAAVKIEKNIMPEIVFCQSFPIQIRDTSDHKKYLDSMLKTLDEAVLSVRKSLIKIGNAERIKNHYFFIGSPWSISQSKMIKVVKDRPYEVNNAFLKRIITNEETETEKQMEQNSGENNWRVLEEKIMESKLNGYQIEKIFGKKTTDFETEMFVSFIPYEMQNKIYSFAGAKLKKSSLKHAGSPMLSSYSFLRDIYPEKSDFIYVDMGSFLTDVYIVKDNIISAIASFPSGEKEIMQSAEKRTKMSEYLLYSSVNIHNDDNYDVASKKDFEKHIDLGLDQWLAKLSDSLSKLCTEFSLPKDIFIIPKDGFSKFIAKEISGKKDNKLKVFGMEMEAQIVDEQLMNGRIVNGKMFLNEPYVKMDTVFLAKMIG